jgi:hypothetical protein
MVPRSVGDRADKWAENALLRLVGRCGQAVIAPIVVAGILWLGNLLWTFNNTMTQSTFQIQDLSKNLDRALVSLDSVTREISDLRIKNADQDQQLIGLRQRLERTEADALSGRPLRR